MELGSLRTFNSSVTPSDSRDFFTYTAAKLCILHPAPERERLLTFQVGKHETEMGRNGCGAERWLSHTVDGNENWQQPFCKVAEQQGSKF